MKHPAKEAHLSGSVDSEECSIAVRGSNIHGDGAGSSPIPADSWRPACSVCDAPLMTALLSCEHAGRLFSPAYDRNAFMTSWLASQTDALPCGDGRQIAFSIPGDGFARRAALSGQPTASGDWELEGEIAYAEGLMVEVAAVVVGMKVANQPALLLVPVQQRGVVLKEQVMLDPSRPGITVLLGRPAPARGRCIFVSEKAEAAAAALRSLSRTLVAAEMLGIATMVLELAVRYARKRFQFGKPLCEFQAVSHACADMLCDVELTRSLLYGVGKRPTRAGVPTSADAAKAKFLAGELCPRVVDRAVHVFGAEGLTWDRGLHFAVRRIQALRTLWGDPLACEAELAAEIGL